MADYRYGIVARAAEVDPAVYDATGNELTQGFLEALDEQAVIAFTALREGPGGEIVSHAITPIGGNKSEATN